MNSAIYWMSDTKHPQGQICRLPEMFNSASAHNKEREKEKKLRRTGEGIRGAGWSDTKRKTIKTIRWRWRNVDRANGNVTACKGSGEDDEWMRVIPCQINWCLTLSIFNFTHFETYMLENIVQYMTEKSQMLEGYDRWFLSYGTFFESGVHFRDCILNLKPCLRVQKWQC